MVPQISFVIPAHNEETLIAQTLDSIRDSTPQAASYEIVVVDDTSTDQTAQIAEARGAKVVNINRRHISAARNAGAKQALGELFVFVDADTSVTPEAIRGAIDAIRDGFLAGGAVVKFDGQVPLYARLFLRLATLAQKRIGFAAGCFVFSSRDAFEQSGGFDESIFAGEEVEFSKSLKKLGPFKVLKSPVITSGRKLRAHSCWTILGTLASLMIRGKRGVRSRDRLSLWYDTKARG
ncbi:MAG: glycosyltransferase [Phycisphaerales bacterium]